MRTFYMFKINEDYSQLTKNLPYNLYSTYLNIKLSNKSNMEYIYEQYKSITAPIDAEALSEALFRKMQEFDGYTAFHKTHMYNNYYSDEVSKLTFYRSFIVLKSNKPNSTFFSILHSLPNIFVIDFENKDYFWLASLSNLRLVNA